MSLEELALRPEQLVGAIVRSLRAENPVMIWGAPGIGKSELVMTEVAEATGLDPWDFRANSKEPVDLRGLPYVDRDHSVTRWIVPEDLPRGPSLMFIDEINTCVSSMFAPLYQVIQSKRLGNWEAHADTRIIAAGNREKDRTISNKMPSALLTRMSHFTLIPDHDQWCRWGAKTGRVDPQFIAFIRAFPQFFNDFDPAATTSPLPRTIEAANKVWRQNPPADTAMHELAACVGPGFATAFLAFVSLWGKIPDLDEIFASPKTAPVPNGKDAMSVRFATAAAISHKMAPANMLNACVYLDRLGEEFSVFAIKDAHARDNSLSQCDAFLKWGLSHSDMLG